MTPLSLMIPGMGLWLQVSRLMEREKRMCGHVLSVRSEGESMERRNFMHHRRTRKKEAKMMLLRG